MLEESSKTKRMHSKIKIRWRYSKPILLFKTPPKHIFEKTILQHTFKFCKPLDSFLTFRLVCKLWQNAAETIKFDQFNESHVLEKYESYPKFVCKYLKVFKKLHVDIFYNRPMIEWGVLGALTVKNMKNLNEVKSMCFLSLSETQQSFIEDVLRNSNETLKKISLSKLIFPNISFPRTTEIVLNVCDDISPDQFETNFPQILKNMENLEIVTFQTHCAMGYYDKYNMKHFKYIGEKYPERCISAGNNCDAGFLVEFMPLKIVTDIYNLSSLQNPKCNHALEYLDVILLLGDFDDSMMYGWDYYHDILDQHFNLKQIALTFVDFFQNDGEDQESVNVDFKNHADILGPYMQTICNEILEYFKKRKIKIVTQDKIRGNTSLQSKVAKEAGIRWRFSFT